jgi:hypothetical protein
MVRVDQEFRRGRPAGEGGRGHGSSFRHPRPSATAIWLNRRRVLCCVGKVNRPGARSHLLLLTGQKMKD